MTTPTDPANWRKIVDTDKRIEDVCRWHREQEAKSNQEEKK